jgi:hypothetical protein
MAGSTNFKQFDSTAANIATDVTYDGSSQQTGGFVSGICPSNMMNKVLFQSSTFVAAFATVLANLGYAVSDSSFTALEAVLTNIIAINQAGGISAQSNKITNMLAGVNSGDAVNMGQFLASMTANGYQKLPGGLIIQWGTSVTNSGGVGTVVFPIAFPNTCLSVNTTVTGSATFPSISAFSEVSELSVTQFVCYTITYNNLVYSGGGFTWFAIGC